MYDCDCNDEETGCSDARVQGEERIQQVLSVASNTSKQFATNNDDAHFEISLKFSK